MYTASYRQPRPGQRVYQRINDWKGLVESVNTLPPPYLGRIERAIRVARWRLGTPFRAVADLALYQAKREGRDRIAVAPISLRELSGDDPSDGRLF